MIEIEEHGRKCSNDKTDVQETKILKLLSQM